MTEIIRPRAVQPVASAPAPAAWRRPMRGSPSAPILVVCDPQTADAAKEGGPLDRATMRWFAFRAQQFGFESGDMFFVSSAPPIPELAQDSASRKWKHVEQFVPELLTLIDRAKPRMVVAFGELASRACIGRAVAITKARGVTVMPTAGKGVQSPVMPFLSPLFVRRVPDHEPTLQADLCTLARLKDARYNLAALAPPDVDYRWVSDLTEFMAGNPRVIYYDTETTGLQWWKDDVRVLTVQFCDRPGRAVAAPIHPHYFRKVFPDVPMEQLDRLRAQVKQILEDPTIKKMGHNIKYDHQLSTKEGIEVKGWMHDTQLMAFFVDENMMSTSLDNCVRVWVPEMSGYCVVPGTKLLTADMRWVEAGSVVEGDELVGFDEHPSPKCRRKMRNSIVEHSQRLLKPCYRIVMASGREVTVSDNHQFLKVRPNYSGGSIKWRMARELKVGDILKTFPMEQQATTFDAGWLAGLIDGEGSLCGQGTSGNALRLSWAQVQGPVLDKSLEIAHGLGAKVCVSHSKTGKVSNVTALTWEAMRLLQVLRPMRLLGTKRWDGVPLPTTENDKIVAIDYVGVREVVALKTSTHTFIAEGICSHNSDEFDQTVDKARMIDVPPEKILPYACGDVDGGFRLARALDALLKRDPKQHKCYRKIQFPALLSFAKVIERWGITIDQQRLREFSADVGDFMREEYRRLVRLVPAQVRREMIAADGEVSFKDANMRKILFSKSGFNLKPVVFTKSTQKLGKEERVPSVSIKDHLPYFKHVDGNAGAFVNGIIGYQQAAKLQSTYAGSEGDGTGFWQHIASDGRIYPSYKLHATVTGRTASENPNGQNFPKRGRFAKPYLRCFIPRRGYKFVSADLSQIELRIAAWMAGEPTMLEIYRNDGDIHTATAMATMGVDEAGWRALAKADKKLNRTKAKAVNFGFLYGMGAKKFKDYAKTQYDVDYTDAEAELARVRFFAKYSRLEAWHKAMRTFVQNNGYVRALHGAVRHLPGINSIDEKIRGEAQRQAINSPVQRFGSDLGLLALWRFSFQAPPEYMHLVGFVHDALVMEVADGYEAEAAAALLYAMEEPPLHEYFGITAPLPIKAEADIGLNQGDIIEFAELPDELPAWLAELNMPIVEKDGKRSFDIHAAKPSWWNDDWRTVEQQFLYERLTA